MLRRYHRGPCPHALKPDGSPSSAADVEAEDLIVAALAGRFPGIAVVAEERAQGDTTRPADLFFLVDPLDGTRDFLAGTPDYSVNIALVAGERPVAAALAAPGLDRVWWAGSDDGRGPGGCGPPGRRAAGARARRRRRPASSPSAAGGTAMPRPPPASPPCPVLETRQVGSALKFGLIAAGEADIYVRCGPTMEWDTAAGDHIVAAAGGCVVVPGGGPIRYGQDETDHRNGPFAALGDPTLADRLALPACGDGRPGGGAAQRGASVRGTSCRPRRPGQAASACPARPGSARNRARRSASRNR